MWPRDTEPRNPQQMVKDLRRRGVQDERVLAAMAEVPRHLFIAKPVLQGRAYAGNALPIGADQTISQPYTVARTCELLGLEAHHSVLEIGTGTGYHTAVLARLVARVYSLERVHELTREAIRRIRELGIDNVKIQTFDGTVGWSEVGPFDRILVTAAAPAAPRPLLEQLKPGGRLLIPEGHTGEQRLVLYTFQGDRVIRQLGEKVSFVPLIGRYGWSSAEEAGEGKS